MSSDEEIISSKYTRIVSYNDTATTENDTLSQHDALPILSVAVFTDYYIGLIGGEELGDRLILSPFFAMWTPNLIFSIAGLFGLWRIRKPGNSPHGGDWSDLLPAWIAAAGNHRWVSSTAIRSASGARGA